MRSSTLLRLLIAFALTFASCAQQSSEDTNIPLDVKIGQMIKIGFRGMQVADTNHIARDLETYHLGGVVLFDYDVPRDTAYRNIQSPEQVKQLVEELKALSEKPLIVSIDQ